MKKVISILLVLVMLTLTACTTTQPSAPEEAITEVEVLGQTVQVVPGSKLDTILKTKTITLATSPDFAPYEFVILEKLGQGDEQYAGWDIELARYIAQCLDVKLVIEPMSYDAVLASITEGKADLGISGIAPKPERREKMDFSDIYYSKENGAGHGFLINIKSNDKFKSIDDYNNAEVTIAVQNASLQQTGVAAEAPNAKTVIVGQLNEAILEVINGKVDAMAVSIESAYNFVNTYPNDLMISDVKLDIQTDGLAIAVTKGNEDLVEVLNIIVNDAKETGKMATWVEEATALSEAQSTAE